MKATETSPKKTITPGSAPLIDDIATLPPGGEFSSTGRGKSIWSAHV